MVARQEPRVNPDRVRRVRLSLGLSQRELAEKLECSTRAVQMWEADEGTSRPHGHHLRALAQLAEQPIAWFFEDEAAA